MPCSISPGVLDAVSRGVEIDRRDTAVVLTLTLRTPLGVSAADLWPELTRADRLAQWYGPVEIDTDEPPRFRAVGGAHGRVLEAESPHHLRLTWEYGANADALEISLDPEDDGTTLLELVHTSEVPAEVFDTYGPGAAALGWDIALLGLVAHTGGWRELRLDVPSPSPAWLASEEGADHVAAWSIRWAAASMAAGTDETAARHGEAETTRAYGSQPDAAAV